MKLWWELELLDPWFLCGLLPIWVLLAWRLRARTASLPVADLNLVQALPRTARLRLRHLPLVLQALALSLLCFALARPVSKQTLPLKEKGIDIVLAMDVSSSMQNNDMFGEGGRRTRIEVARRKAMDFAAARRHDRVGLVSFAAFPELRCPLTLDQDALKEFLEPLQTVRPRSEEDRTAIGLALAKCVQVLEPGEAKSKVVVLLSDGENNVLDVTPEDAARLAKDKGMRVYCIGIGRRNLGHGFVSLQRIAELSEGMFFRAESEDDLAKAYAQIDELEKIELEDPRYRVVEWFLYPLVVGLGLLLLGLGLELSWLRALP